MQNMLLSKYNLVRRPRATMKLIY